MKKEVIGNATLYLGDCREILPTLPTLDAEQFAKVTGWTGSSNQHERDAAMVAWQYWGSA